MHKVKANEIHFDYLPLAPKDGLPYLMKKARSLCLLVT